MISDKKQIKEIFLRVIFVRTKLTIFLTYFKHLCCIPLLYSKEPLNPDIGFEGNSKHSGVNHARKSHITTCRMTRFAYLVRSGVESDWTPDFMWGTLTMLLLPEVLCSASLKNVTYNTIIVSCIQGCSKSVVKFSSTWTHCHARVVEIKRMGLYLDCLSPALFSLQCNVQTT